MGRNDKDSSQKKVKYSLLDFNIYPTLHPPPFSDKPVDIGRNIIEPELTTTTTTTTTALTTTTSVAAFVDTFYYEDVSNVVDDEAEDDTYNKTDCPGDNLRVCVEAC